MLLAAARRLLPALCLIAVLVPPAAAQELDVAITYLGRQEAPPIPLSLVEPVLTDEGIKGAQQAIRDNQTTGRFLKHAYRLNERVVPPDGDIAAEFNAALAAGERLFVADLHIDDLLAIAASGRRRRRPDLQRAGRGRRAAHRSVLQEHLPHRAIALDEGRCAGAVSGLEALAALVSGPGLAPRGPEARRGLPARRRALRRRDRRRAGLRGYGRRPAHRHRARADPEPDAGLHPGRGRLRRARRRRRGGRVRRVPALPHLGRATRRRQRRAHAGRLEPGPGAMGRHPGAAPVREVRRPADDRARLRLLAGRAHDRRGGDPLARTPTRRPCTTTWWARISRSRPSRARA